MNKMRKKATAVLFYPAIDEIDDVDAKQYHRASFSTRNSVLNTSLRKPIRMQDFIQLCDSIWNWEIFNNLSFSCVRIPVSVILKTDCSSAQQHVDSFSRRVSHAP